MMGARGEDLSLRKYDAELADALQNPGDRPHYIRGRVTQGKFSAVGRQESHALYGLSRANALLRVSPGETLPAGISVSVLTLD
jgi:molybdopterin molybdotransferase